MENGGRPAADAHEKATPDLRARVIKQIITYLAKTPKGHQADVLRLHKYASEYEAKVFSESANSEEYLRTISHKMLCLEQKLRSAGQAASAGREQQQAQNQMQPVDAVLANSSGATMPPPQTASAIPLHQLHTRVHQAQLHPCHQTVVTQQPRPRMNQQDLRPSYQAHNKQHANVAIMQCGAENHQQLRNPQQHPAGEVVDWREDMFLKITSLKDAHFTELAEYGRALQAWVLGIDASGHLDSLSPEQAKRYQYLQQSMERTKNVLNFLQVEKANIPQETSLDKLQTLIHHLLRNYNLIKTRQRMQNCRAPPHQVVNICGAADNSQQNHHHHEQRAAEAVVSPYSQDAPYGTQQQNRSDNFAGEAEDNSVCGEAESPVAVNLPGDTSRFTQERYPAFEAIPQLTQTVEHAGTHSAHFQAEDDSVRAEAERPVGMEVNTVRSFSVSPRSLVTDMGVNFKRAFHHTTPEDAMDGSSRRMRVDVDDESSRKSFHKKRKTYGSALEEIRVTTNKLVETEIKIHEDGTGGAEGTLIELCYNAVSLTPKLREAVCASEISTKLFVHADYPQSSPLILGGDGEGKQGVPGVVDTAFRRAIVLLPEPRSIEAVAKAWDAVVRRAVVQFAHRLGGGTFSSRYGQWVTCVPV